MGAAVGYGSITIGVPGGGPCYHLGFDLAKGKSWSAYHFERPDDIGFEVAEPVVMRICKGRIPGSHRTSRLRKKRRKAVMAVVPKLVSMGLLGRFEISFPMVRGEA